MARKGDIEKERECRRGRLKNREELPRRGGRRRDIVPDGEIERERECQRGR